MEAGRESDARIAELQGHVVEWRWCQQYPDEYEPEEIEHLFSEEGAKWGDGPKDLEEQIASGHWDIHKEPCIKIGGHYVIAPHYTTDIRAAMELWDEMTRDRGTFDTSLTVNKDNKSYFKLFPLIGSVIGTGLCETRELAICNAYEEWKGKDPDGSD